MRLALALVILAGCSSKTSPASDDLSVAAADLSAPPAMADLARSPDLAAGPTVQVTVTDDKYTPSMLTIAVGTTVKWSFQAAGPHGVFPLNNSFPPSPVMAQGTYAYTFTSPGTYDYQCAVHGSMMPGQILVK